MDKQQNNGVANPDPVDQLGAIKSIIFGTEMQELSSRIKQLGDSQVQTADQWKARVDQLEARLTEEMEDLRKSLLSEMNTRFDSLQADLDQVNEAKADRKQLGEWLKKLGDQLLQG